MPYAGPSSPLPSPSKDTHFRRGQFSPSDILNDLGSSPSYTGPMPGIPRRTPSNPAASSSSSTSPISPRRASLSPGLSRNPSAGSTSFAASRPMEGLPRRSSAGSPAMASSVAGLPHAGSSSLGLKLHPSPTKAPVMRRGLKDSMSSTSTADSSLPPTPDDEPRHLPLDSPSASTPESSIPFPTFEPPPKIYTQHRPMLSNQRRGSAQGHYRGGNGLTGSLQINFPSSASTPHLPPLPSPQPSSSHLRPTASMIRKKSGEVVKPSLKVRSMSTPDLSRQAGSDPDSPEQEEGRPFGDERSKSVRFAGADEADGELESVVLFLREQKVTAVGKAADPEYTGGMTETETEGDNDNDTDASDFVQFRTRRNAAARAADEADRIVLEGGSRVPRVRVDFGPDARGALAGEHVVLERLELVGQQGLQLKGSVMVRNVSFQKWVAVRFTMDHWQTLSEVTGTHVCHIPSSTTGDEGWDRFSFGIKLEDFKRKLDERVLIMCIRFSAEGQEWWDSNNGMNYSFTFKKVPAPRRTHLSGPATFGNGFMRVNDASATTLPGVRTGKSMAQAQISKAFGASSAAKSDTPHSWVFPKFPKHLHHDRPVRPDSPVQTAPPTAFVAPAPPDVHTHLTLSKYCAPSPPQSPPKDTSVSTVPLAPSPSTEKAQSEFTPKMNILGGNYVTVVDASTHQPAATEAATEASHERRSSWNGEPSGWESFAQAMEHVESNDGDATPTAAGARSPAGKASGSSSDSDSSPRAKPLTMKRSFGDLRALVDETSTPPNGPEQNLGLITPPPSNLSSPPTPTAPDLPVSPATSSATSTGQSSPVNTVSTDSTADLEHLAIDIDPAERGRASTPNGYKMLSNNYQEFLDKFCFFQSPRMTPNELEPVYSRPSFVPSSASGYASPTAGFPFYHNHHTHSNGSNSPRSTPTPTRQYDSASDAFGFAAPAGGTTPKATAAVDRAAAKDTTPKPSPPFPAQLAHPSSLIKQLHRAESPSVAAAK